MTTLSPRRSTACTRPNDQTPQPWLTLEKVESATAEWVDWFNHHSLYEYCGHIPPVEPETAYYARPQSQAAG